MYPFDEILDAVNGLFEALIGVVYLVLYPLIALVSIIVGIVYQIYDKFLSLIGNILSIPVILIDFTEGVFVDVLPLTMIILFGALLMIVVGLRIYSFIKDVEILGFKI